MPVTNTKSNWESGRLVFRDNSASVLDVIGEGFSGKIYNVRTRFTTAQVNAGATVLSAIAGYKYRLIDCTLIAIGGNAATATSVDILATQSSSSAKLLAAAVAALTQSAAVKPNTANVTLLADGASFIANDANTAITVGKTGSSLATATAIDVILTYAIEEA